MWCAVWKRQCCSSVSCACVCAASSPQHIAVSPPLRPVVNSIDVGGGAVAPKNSPFKCEGELCRVS